MCIKHQAEFFKTNFFQHIDDFSGKKIVLEFGLKIRVKKFCVKIDVHVHEVSYLRQVKQERTLGSQICLDLQVAPSNGPHRHSFNVFPKITTRGRSEATSKAA